MFEQFYISSPEDLVHLHEYYSIEIGATAIFFTLIKYEKASNQPTARKFIQNLGKDLDEILANIDLTLKLQKIAPPINLYISKEVQSVRILLNTPTYREPINTFWFGKYKGKTIDEVATLNPKYLKWVANNFQIPFGDPQKIEFVNKIKQKFSQNSMNENSCMKIFKIC